MHIFITRKKVFLANYFIFCLLILSVLSCSNKKNKEIFASGTIETTEINISSKVSGQIKKLFINEGSIVKPSDILAEIDHSTTDLQLVQAKAAQDLADAQLQLLLNGARSEDIQLAEEELKKAEINYKTAKDDYTRTKELFDLKSVTQKQFDDAESKYIIVQSQLNSAKQSVQKFKQWARPEDIRAAQAKVDQGKATVAILQKAIEDSFIKSPINGTVTNKPVENGELVGQGTIIATISKLDKVYLAIYVTERELGSIKLNQDAEIKIDAYPNRVFNGKVIYISPIAEFTPKNIQTKEERVKLVFRVKIEIDNPDEIFKPGLPADAKLITS